MKLKLAAIIMAFAAINAFGAAQINWANTFADSGDLTSDQNIYDESGNLLSTSASGYTLYLVLSSDSTINWNPTTLSVGAGETVLYSVQWSSAAWDNGAFFDPVQSGVASVVNNSFLYSVIVHDTAGIDYSAILDGAGTTGGAATDIGTSGSGIYDYNTTGLSHLSPHNWVAVPEPSTYAFLGLGLVLFALRRYRRAA